MIIKKYLVNTVEEVQKLIAKELGPNAVILTSRHIRYKGLKALFFSNKVEVVAAVDEQDYQHFQEGLKGIPENHEWESPIQTLVENNDTPKKLTGLEEPSNYEASPILGTYLDPRFNRKNNDFIEEKFEAVPPLKKRPRLSDEAQNLADGLIQRFGHLVFPESEVPFEGEVLRNLVYKEIAPPPNESLMAYFSACGIAPVIAKKIQASLDERFKQVEPQSLEWPEALEEIKRITAAMIRVSGPICLSKEKQKLVALVGGRDCGKTSVAVQIAVQYMLEIGKRVAIISQQPRTIEEKEWVKAFADSFSIPLDFFEIESDLKEVIEQYRENDLVLIDTCGTASEVESVLKGLNEVEVQLVLSCAAKDIDSLAIFKEYKRVQIASIIFTKLDETISRGSLLNLALIIDAPVSYAAFGVNLPDDLWVADPKNLANAIFEKFYGQDQILEEILQSLTSES